MFGYSFVNPLFLYGLAAISAPIIIHLLFKARKRQVLFSSIRFILASTVRRKSRIKFRELLLLLLRIGIFALIALAFARPFLKHGGSSALAMKGKVDLVIILDDSYSTMYTDPNGRTTFEGVRAAALEAVGKLRQGDRVALVKTSGNGSLLLKPSPNFAYARKLVQDVKPSFEGCVYSKALNTAKEQLIGSGADEKIIYFVSDLQRVSLDRSEVEKAIGVPGLAVELKDVAKEERPNVAIKDVRLPQWGWVPGSPVVLNVSVSNYSELPCRNVSVEVEAAAQKFPSESVDLSPGQTREIVLTMNPSAGKALPGVVRISGHDRLAVDDVHYFYLSPTKSISVLCVEEGITRLPDFQETIYLRTALDPRASEEQPQGYVEPRQVEPASLAAEPLSAAEVVVLANVSGLTVQQVERLEDYVQNGGGLLIFLGNRVEQEIYNKLLFKPGGRGLLPCSLKPSRKATTYWFIKKFDGTHNVFKPFLGRHGEDLSLPRVYQRFDVDYNFLEPPKDVRVLATYDDGEPAVLEKPFGRGKVILVTTRCFTTAWDPGWTDFPRRMVFVPFVHQLIRYLSGREMKAVKGYKVGDRLVIPASELGATGTVFVKHPGGQVVSLNVDESGFGVLQEASEPGIYLASASSEFQDCAGYAVNLDTFESDLTHMSKEEVEWLSSMGRGSEEEIAVASRRAMLFHGGGEASTFWRTLLILALAFMVCELLLANTIAR